jgi:pentatricopeptide repeat protein
MAYNTCITSWCSVGAVDEAERCLASMVQAGLKPNESTYPELIRVLASRGRVRDAEAYLVRARRARQRRRGSRRAGGPARVGTPADRALRRRGWSPRG